MKHLRLGHEIDNVCGPMRTCFVHEQHMFLTFVCPFRCQSAQKIIFYSGGKKSYKFGSLEFTVQELSISWPNHKHFIVKRDRFEAKPSMFEKVHLREKNVHASGSNVSGSSCMQLLAALCDTRYMRWDMWWDMRWDMCRASVISYSPPSLPGAFSTQVGLVLSHQGFNASPSLLLQKKRKNRKERKKAYFPRINWKLVGKCLGKYQMKVNSKA